MLILDDGLVKEHCHTQDLKCIETTIDGTLTLPWPRNIKIKILVFNISVYYLKAHRWDHPLVTHRGLLPSLPGPHSGPIDGPGCLTPMNAFLPVRP